MSQTYSPEVINQHVENAQQHDQKDSAPLGLESNNDHNTRNETEQADNDSPQTPLAGEDKADEEEDQEHTTSELDVHLAVLLVQLRQSGWDELLAHPRVRQHHEQTTDDTQVAEEEVEIEDETVSETLRDHDGEQTGDRHLGVFTGDNEEGTYRHGNDVEDEEGMRETPWD